MQTDLLLKPASEFGVGADTHFVEGAVDEGERHQEEDGGENVRHGVGWGGGQWDGELDGEKAEERSEFDDRVEGDGGGVLEGIADGVANDGGVVERRACLLECDLEDFIGVV